MKIRAGGGRFRAGGGNFRAAGCSPLLFLFMGNTICKWDSLHLEPADERPCQIVSLMI